MQNKIIDIEALYVYVAAQLSQSSQLDSWKHRTK